MNLEDFCHFLLFPIFYISIVLWGAFYYLFLVCDFKNIFSFAFVFIYVYMPCVYSHPWRPKATLDGQSLWPLQLPFLLFIYCYWLRIWTLSSGLPLSFLSSRLSLQFLYHLSAGPISSFFPMWRSRLGNWWHWHRMTFRTLIAPSCANWDLCHGLGGFLQKNPHISYPASALGDKERKRYRALLAPWEF